MSGYKSDEKDSDYIPSDYDEGEDEIKYVKQFFTILPPPNDELRTLEDLHSALELFLGRFPQKLLTPQYARACS